MILTIRETYTISDIYTDMEAHFHRYQCVTMEFNIDNDLVYEFSCNTGFLRRIFSLLYDISQCISYYEYDSMTICGYSLGGSCSQIIGYIIFILR